VKQKQVEEMKAQNSKTVIIVFDGHGFCNKEKPILTYKHYFLCNVGETVGSDKFNLFFK